MSEVTQFLKAMDEGDPHAPGELLSLVYDELRRLAAQKMAHEAPGQTLSATALVHEAYLRLIEGTGAACWENRRHFLGAAAEAMRRILVENARRKRSLKRGGGRVRLALDHVEPAAVGIDADLVVLDEALRKLEARDPVKAKVVELRYFSGLTIPQTAEVLNISTATAERYWSYARAWLRVEILGSEAPAQPRRD